MFTKHIEYLKRERKYVGITIKSKETSSQLEPIRNSYVATMHQSVTVSSNM